jgi:calcineurin-like phosphoesterase
MMMTNTVRIRNIVKKKPMMVVSSFFSKTNPVRKEKKDDNEQLLIVIFFLQACKEKKNLCSYIRKEKKHVTNLHQQRFSCSIALVATLLYSSCNVIPHIALLCL